MDIYGEHTLVCLTPSNHSRNNHHKPHLLVHKVNQQRQFRAGAPHCAIGLEITKPYIYIYIDISWYLYTLYIYAYMYMYTIYLYIYMYIMVSIPNWITIDYIPPDWAGDLDQISVVGTCPSLDIPRYGWTWCNSCRLFKHTNMEISHVYPWIYTLVISLKLMYPLVNSHIWKTTMLLMGKLTINGHFQ